MCQQQQQVIQRTKPRTSSKRRGQGRRGGVENPFPERLFDLLDDADERNPLLSSIISWHSNGKYFTVHDRTAFQEIIQSKYFSQTKFASFRRQLNLWGFERVNDYALNHGHGGTFFHPMFQRHDRSLCCAMKRTKLPISSNFNRDNAPKNKEDSSSHSKNEEGSFQEFEKAANVYQHLLLDTARNCGNIMPVTISEDGHSTSSAFSTGTCPTYFSVPDSLCYDQEDTNKWFHSPTNQCGNKIQRLSSTQMQEYDDQLLNQKKEANKEEEEGRKNPLDFDQIIQNIDVSTLDQKSFKEFLDYLSANEENVSMFLFGEEKNRQKKED